MKNRIHVPIFNNPTVIALLFCLAVISGFFTYRGAALAITAEEITWMSQSAAVLFAISASTSIFLLWTVAPHAVARLQTTPERLVGMCITIVSAFLIACLSSWLNVAGIAGASAIAIHLNVMVAEFEDILDQRHTAVVAIKSLQPDLKQANVLYLNRQASEAKRGAYTGVAGNGAVAQLLGSVAGRYGELDTNVSTELTRLAATAQQTRQILSAMRAVSNQPGDLTARLENLAREADKVRALLGELNAQGVLGSLQRSLQAMPREAALYPVTTKSAKTAKAQRAALDRVARELTETAEQLGAEIQRLSATPLPPIPDVERLNPIEAVLRYPLQNAPYWAGGIALDFTPTLLLLYALLIVYTRGRMGLFVDDVGDLTVRDLKKAQHAQHVLREGLISQDSTDRLHDELTGDDRQLKTIEAVRHQPKEDDNE